MDLNPDDRRRLREVTDDVIGCAAMPEYRMVYVLLKAVALGWGEQGMDHVMFLLAQDVVEHAPSAARNAFAKVTADAALGTSDREALECRLREGGLPEGADMDALYTLAEKYLDAVWRDEPADRQRVVSRLRASGRLPAARMIVLAMAAIHAPEAGARPTPPKRSL
ncbi:hypothetical protein [Streptomyces goshikiensis]|uniref:hypothetical protein n=1 Tax=Streptomyces goshikiensis TaxID=1942 RepID=UPI0036BE3AD2